jgi:hypothetical protein
LIAARLPDPAWLEYLVAVERQLAHVHALKHEVLAIRGQADLDAAAGRLDKCWA